MTLLWIVGILVIAYLVTVKLLKLNKSGLVTPPDGWGYVLVYRAWSEWPYELTMVPTEFLDKHHPDGGLLCIPSRLITGTFVDLPDVDTYRGSIRKRPSKILLALDSITINRQYKTFNKRRNLT